MMTPGARLEAVAYLEELFEASQHQACDVLGVYLTTVWYRSQRSDDAGSGSGCGCWPVSAAASAIAACTGWAAKSCRSTARSSAAYIGRRSGRCVVVVIASGPWAQGRPMAIPQGRNQRWSSDFVSDAFSRGRRFQILAVVDDFTRACIRLIADTSITGLRVAREPVWAIAEQPCYSGRRQ